MNQAAGARRIAAGVLAAAFCAAGGAAQAQVLRGALDSPVPTAAQSPVQARPAPTSTRVRPVQPRPLPPTGPDQNTVFPDRASERSEAAAQGLDPAATGSVPDVQATSSDSAVAAGVEPGQDPARQTQRALDLGDASQPPAVLRVGEAPPPRRARAEDDGYAPLGIQAGSFTLRPTFDLGIGYSDNAQRAAGGSGSGYAYTSAELGIASNWARHAVTATLRGSYSSYFSASDENAPRLGAEIAGRLDVGDFSRIDLALRAAQDSERRSDPNTPANATTRPKTYTYGASLGGTVRPNRLGVTLEGSVDRYAYADATLNDGTIYSGVSRDYTAYQLRLRSGYEFSPALEPFVEVGANKRIYDEEVDPACNCGERGSSGVFAAAGLRLTPSPILGGTLRVGYQRQTPDDKTKPDLAGALFDASIVWQPSALTTVTGTVGTVFDETVLPGSSGALRRTARVEVQHAFRRYLIAIGALGIERASYTGIDLTDTTKTAEIALEYRFNRMLALRGRVAHEALSSSQAGRDYSANLFELGLRVRR